MKPIFEYIDYRKFLADYYQNKKETSRYFSYRFFSQKIGLNSPSFLKYVIDGKRNLTRQMAERFCKAIDLSVKEKLYFHNLVLFNQAKTSAEKQEHYSVLRTMSESIKELVLNTDQFDYFINWYTPVVRELVCIADFKNNYQAIASAITPHIEQSEVKASIELLLRLKLIELKSDGSYRQTSSAVVAGSSVNSTTVRSFTRSMIEHSKRALDHFDKKTRHVSGITMGISHETYELLTAEIEAFKERVKIIVNKDNSANRIYQMNISLFPMSEEILPETDKNQVKS